MDTNLTATTMSTAMITTTLAAAVSAAAAETSETIRSTICNTWMADAVTLCTNATEATSLITKSQQQHLAECHGLTMSKQQQQQQQDAAATDSGRESVNEGDSSVEETLNAIKPNYGEHLEKKPCTLEFYTSNGSQSKWYLPASDVVKINITNDSEVLIPAVSIAMPESTNITPPYSSDISMQMDINEEPKM